jgi:hypothetical protein
MDLLSWGAAAAHVLFKLLLAVGMYLKSRKSINADLSMKCEHESIGS